MIQVTNQQNPHYGEQGEIVARDVYLLNGTMGPLLRIKKQNGEKFLCYEHDVMSI